MLEAATSGVVPSAPLTWPLPGERVVNPHSKRSYFLGRVLGEGRYGLTYECTNEFAEPLVLKVLKPFRTREQTERDWRKEAHIAAIVRHPNIVHIFDWFEHGGLYALVFERARGTARQLLSLRPPFDAAQTIEFGRQLFSAVDFMHCQGIVHRDLHIDNLLWTGEDHCISLKIADFGIGSHVGRHPDRRSFTKLGREYDVAPELVTRGFTSPRSDLYQVGLSLFALHTGKSAVGHVDGPPSSAVTSGVAARRARELGTPIGDALAELLQVDDALRPKDARLAWWRLRHAAS